MATLNDLVRHQNASEDKKLKFKLSQLENLKNTYSRQKEKEQMYFALQHMTVPVRADPSIYKFRKQKGENEDDYEKEKERRWGWTRKNSKSTTSSVQSSSMRAASRRQKKTCRRSETDIEIEDTILYETDRMTISEEVDHENEEDEEGTFFTTIESSVKNGKPMGKSPIIIASEKPVTNNPVDMATRTSAHIRSSRRIISPHPLQHKNKTKMLKNNEHPMNIKKDLQKSETTPSLENNNIRMDKNARNMKALGGLSSKTQAKTITMAIDPLSQKQTKEATVTNAMKPRKSEKQAAQPMNPKLCHGKRKMSRGFSWNKCRSPQNTQGSRYIAPRLNDLPSVSINIYEVPCDEKEAREKWKINMDNIRDSFIKDQRSENEIDKDNREILYQWQTRYQEMKKNRLAAVVRDGMKLGDGEHMTFVKFLPKSRQSQLIKEKSLLR